MSSRQGAHVAVRVRTVRRDTLGIARQPVPEDDRLILASNECSLSS